LRPGRRPRRGTGPAGGSGGPDDRPAVLVRRRCRPGSSAHPAVLRARIGTLRDRGPRPRLGGGELRRANCHPGDTETLRRGGAATFPALKSAGRAPCCLLARASVPIPKFASTRGTFLCELRNRRTLATC